GETSAKPATYRSLHFTRNGKFLYESLNGDMEIPRLLLIASDNDYFGRCKTRGASRPLQFQDFTVRSSLCIVGLPLSGYRAPRPTGPGHSPGAGSGDAVSPGPNRHRFVGVNKIIRWDTHNCYSSQYRPATIPDVIGIIKNVPGS